MERKTSWTAEKRCRQKRCQALIQALLDAEARGKVSLVTEEEIETFSQANKARLQGDKATVREQSRAQLQNQKLATQRQAFLQALRSQATVVMHLKAPSVFRAQVATNGVLAKEKSGSMGSGLAWPHASALRG
jgi:hypothetical protein